MVTQTEGEWQQVQPKKPKSKRLRPAEEGVEPSPNSKTQDVQEESSDVEQQLPSKRPKKQAQLRKPEISREYQHPSVLDRFQHKQVDYLKLRHQLFAQYESLQKPVAHPPKSEAITPDVFKRLISSCPHSKREAQWVGHFNEQVAWFAKLRDQGLIAPTRQL